MAYTGSLLLLCRESNFENNFSLNPNHTNEHNNLVINGHALGCCVMSPSFSLQIPLPNERMNLHFRNGNNRAVKTFCLRLIILSVKVLTNLLLHKSLT